MIHFTLSKIDIKNSCGDDLGVSPPQLFGRGGDHPHHPMQSAPMGSTESESQLILTFLNVVCLHKGMQPHRIFCKPNFTGSAAIKLGYLGIAPPGIDYWMARQTC